MNTKLKLVGAFVLGLSVMSLLLCGCGSSNTKQTVTSTASSASTNNGVQSTAATGGESLSVSLSNQQVNPGDTFTVNLMINTKVASRGAQAALTFDPSAMECTGVTEGNFYSNWATANGVSTTMMPSSPDIDNTNGTVEVTAVAIMGQSAAEQAGQALGGAQGQGIFLSYQMTAKSGVNKNASVGLSDVEILDPNANSIKGVASNNAQVTIGTP
jgi:hypothetical protein